MSVADAMRTIERAKAVGPARLRLAWSDGSEAELDLGAWLAKPAFAALRDPAVFAKVQVGDWGHSLAWPGDIEAGADALWLETLSATRHNDARAFLEWRLKHGLSLTRAAEALGLSRRMVAYYSNGEKPVPKTVLLACRGWEGRGTRARESRKYRQKATTFTGILDLQFKWPTPGEKLFSSIATDDDAILAPSAGLRLVLMADGYFEAGQLLTEEALDDVTQRDTLVYPIVFCFRQFIELSIKALLARYGWKVGVGSNWQDHDLAKLWCSFSEMTEKYTPDESNDGTWAVADYIGEFAKIDPMSLNFRYPVNKMGATLALQTHRIDLTQLADNMLGVQGYFTGTDGYLDALGQSLPF